MKSFNISSSIVKSMIIAAMIAVSNNAFAVNANADKGKDKDKNYAGYVDYSKPGNGGNAYGKPGSNKPGNGNNKPGNGGAYGKPGNGGAYGKPGPGGPGAGYGYPGYGSGYGYKSMPGFKDNGFGPAGPSYFEKKKYEKKGYFFDYYGNMFKFNKYGKKVFFNKYGKVINFVNVKGYVIFF